MLSHQFPLGLERLGHYNPETIRSLLYSVQALYYIEPHFVYLSVNVPLYLKSTIRLIIKCEINIGHKTQINDRGEL